VPATLDFRGLKHLTPIYSLPHCVMGRVRFRINYVLLVGRTI
jgi:hypothetical protein